MARDVRDFIYGSIEGVLIRVGRFRESGQLPNELKRRCVNLVVCRRRTEVMKCFDSSAHKEPLTADAVVSKVESITRMETDFVDWILSACRAVALAKADHRSQFPAPCALTKQ